MANDDYSDGSGYWVIDGKFRCFLGGQNETIWLSDG